ncbi:hypothetical protein CDD83_4669 [Cordyceps sp. RAO-2017]|nr:hypothetical protein CDD83_4669 [Cordyceps sp. RAO-2017]
MLREHRRRPAHQRQPLTALVGRLIPDPDSLPAVLQFLHEHLLLDDLCLDIVADPELRDALLAAGNDRATELGIGLAELLALPAPLHPKLLETAHSCIARAGPEHFRNRERHLAEILGTYCNMALKAGWDEETASEK